MEFVIGNQVWHMYFLPPFSNIFITESGRVTVGVTDRRTHEVFIANNLHPDFEWKVLCHELVHCSMCTYNVKLSVDQEEIIADLIATYGAEILDVTNRIFGKLHFSKNL